MQYMGSKRRIANEILEIILKERKDNSLFIDLFCGGANVCDKVDGSVIAIDSNEYLIELLIAVRDGWIPPQTVSKEMYLDVRDNKDCYKKRLVAFVGFLCSFGGKWFGGYAANSKGDNYAARGSRVLVKQSDNIKNVMFISSDYLKLDIPINATVYSDPPYRNVTKYSSNFDTDKFWDWCRMQSNRKVNLFISEYEAPSDFKCIWEKEISSTLNKNNGTVRTEKLFKHISLL